MGIVRRPSDLHANAGSPGQGREGIWPLCFNSPRNDAPDDSQGLTGVPDHDLSPEEARDWRVAEEDAQYDAWMRSDRLVDFTGVSYLSEYTNPRYELTPQIEQFYRRIGMRRKAMAQEQNAPVLSVSDLELASDIAQYAFDEGGDLFMRHPDLVGPEAIEIVAAVEEVADADSGFCERLRLSDNKPEEMRRRAREANALLLQRGLRPTFPHYGRFEQGIEAICALSGNDGNVDFGASLGRLDDDHREALLVALATADERKAQSIIDCLAADLATEARNRGWPSYGRPKLVVQQRPQTGWWDEPVTLKVEWIETSTFGYSWSSPGALAGVRVSGRRTCARARAARGSSTRTRGSRRVTSRSAGGGDDPPPGEPEPATKRRGIQGETHFQRSGGGGSFGEPDRSARTGAYGLENREIQCGSSNEKGSRQACRRSRLWRLALVLALGLGVGNVLASIHRFTRTHSDISAGDGVNGENHRL
jgi:hypothetical protein